MKTDLLIVGAGPFGLALAAQARHDEIEHLIAGSPMEFWRKHMPKGMFLRSANSAVAESDPREVSTTSFSPPATRWTSRACHT